jgi:hypothetical protein
VKLTIFEDGSDEQSLKLIKEFKNLIFTYNLWNKPDGSALVYGYFRRFAGSARDLWDQINKIDKEEERDKNTFETHLWELPSEILGADTYQSQKDYLKKTHKPDKMSVKKWVCRMKNINSCMKIKTILNLTLSERELIAKVITPNLPKPWLKNFRLLKLNRKMKIKEALEELLVIEDSIKIEKKQPTHQNGNKNVKKPRRLHNGNHKWVDCRQNTNNSGNNQQRASGQEQKRDGNNNNKHNRNHEEQRNKEKVEGQSRDRTPVRSRRTADYDDEESLCIIDKMENQTKKKVSAEVLIAIPTDKGLKKYVTYLGLLDTGCCGSLKTRTLCKPLHLT